MLYLYDRALCDDLNRSLNSDAMDNPSIPVVSGTADVVMGLAAQLQNDEIRFPVVCIVRDDDLSLDPDRYNFAKTHRGISSVLDTETNELYYEKSIPIKLSYTLCVYTTSQADMDELVRELLFKYLDMYFLTIKLPYESDRKLRFGVRIDPDTAIEKQSGSSEYLTSGELYESEIKLKIDGALLLEYTPAKLRQLTYQVDAN